MHAVGSSIPASATSYDDQGVISSITYQEKNESRPGIMTASVAPAPTNPATITTNSIAVSSCWLRTINQGAMVKFSGARSPSEEPVESW